MDDSKAIDLTPEQLRKLQIDLLDILLEFDRICKKFNIRYALSSGTLLGAVRHKGFIPWDDDVDVDLLREDYEKFCRICEMEINSDKYFFQTYKNDSGYRWFYGKLRRKETEYIRVGQAHLKQKTGLCIDIFPLDAVPNGDFSQRILESGCRVCRKFLWAPVGAKYLKSFYERVIFRLMSWIPKSFILAVYTAMATCVGNEENNMIVSYNTDVRSRYGYAYPRAWFEETVDMEFEGYMFPVPRGYDALLRIKYGDYMAYPKEADRHGNSAPCILQYIDGERLSNEDNN